MTTYSHSRLTTFENCRLAYKFSYIDRIKREEDSIEAFLGSRFHEVMEKVYAERAFWKPSASDLQRYFNELWDKNNWLKNPPGLIAEYVNIEPTKTVRLSKRKDVEEE